MCSYEQKNRSASFVLHTVTDSLYRCQAEARPYSTSCNGALLLVNLERTFAPLTGQYATIVKYYENSPEVWMH